MALFLTHAKPRVQSIIASLASEQIQAHALSFQMIAQTPSQTQACQMHYAGAAQWDHLVFVSPNAVDAFFQPNVAFIRGESSAETSAPNSARTLATRVNPFSDGQLLVTGPGTLAALEHWLGPLTDALAQNRSRQIDSPAFDADGLMAQINELIIAREKSNKRASPNQPLNILVVKGEVGRVDWIAAIRAKGVIVEELQAYCAVDCEPDVDTVSELARHHQMGKSAIIVMSSVANVQRLVAWAQLPAQSGFRQWLEGQFFCGIHPRIVAQLREQSFVNVKEIMPGLDGLRMAALK